MFGLSPIKNKFSLIFETVESEYTNIFPIGLCKEINRVDIFFFEI